MSSPDFEPAGPTSVVERMPPGPPPMSAPYHPPPLNPPPAAQRGPRTDGRAIISVAASILGVVEGRSMAVGGWVLGVAATAIGAVVSLIWLVLLLVSTPPRFE